MSKIRGIFPIFLATGFGVFNGIAIFGPEFKKQEQETLEKAQEHFEVAPATDPTAIEILKEAEADAHTAGATQRLDKPEPSQWSVIRFWEQVKSDEKDREAAEVYNLSRRRASPHEVKGLASQPRENQSRNESI